MSAFDRLHPALQHHVVNSLGWRDLRPVQNLSIDAYLNGANLVVLAPTAGGKTEAAFFPILSQMLTDSWAGLSVLYVSPIRALLNNQQERLARYFRLVGRRSACWHGDTPQSEKRRIVADPPDCLLTTPESLEVILVSTKIDHRHFFRSVRVVVIDELHSFAGDDRGWHLLSVLSRIQRLAGRDIQRVGLSATVGNPAEMLEWLSCGSDRTREVVQPPPSDRKEPRMSRSTSWAPSPTPPRSSGYCTKARNGWSSATAGPGWKQLALLLREQKVETFISHSSLGVEERRLAEQAFAQRQNCVIVATSSLELGIDVGDLDRVIQIDAPATVSSFLQRMGRTGRRADNPSNCLFLATSDEALLRAAALVRLWKQGFVEPVDAPPKPYHILAQQLMALCLQERGIGRSEWFDWLESVPAFRADGPDSRPVARGFDDRQPDPLERPGNPLLRPRGRGKVRAEELHGTSVRLHIAAAFPGDVRAEGAWVRPRIDLLQPEQQAVSPAARRSILEDDPPGLAASNRPCRAIGPEGEITLAG